MVRLNQIFTIIISLTMFGSTYGNLELEVRLILLIVLQFPLTEVNRAQTSIETLILVIKISNMATLV